MAITTDDQKDLIRDFTDDVVNAHDVAGVDEFMAADVTIRGTTEHDGADEFKAYLKAVYSAFPDFAFTLDRIIAEGDTVAFRMTITGTHEGTFEDLPPTGEEFEYPASFFARIEEGKIAHLIYDADRVALLEDLGVMD